MGKYIDQRKLGQYLEGVRKKIDSLESTSFDHYKALRETYTKMADELLEYSTEDLKVKRDIENTLGKFKGFLQREHYRHLSNHYDNKTKELEEKSGTVKAEVKTGYGNSHPKSQLEKLLGIQTGSSEAIQVKLKMLENYFYNPEESLSLGQYVSARKMAESMARSGDLESAVAKGYVSQEQVTRFKNLATESLKKAHYQNLAEKKKKEFDKTYTQAKEESLDVAVVPQGFDEESSELLLEKMRESLEIERKEYAQRQSFFHHAIEMIQRRRQAKESKRDSYFFRRKALA